MDSLRGESALPWRNDVDAAAAVKRRPPHGVHDAANGPLRAAVERRPGNIEEPRAGTYQDKTSIFLLQTRLRSVLHHKIAKSELGGVKRAVEVDVDHTEVRLQEVRVSAADLEYVVRCAYSGVRDDVVELTGWREQRRLLEELNLVLPFRNVTLDEFSPIIGSVPVGIGGVLAYPFRSDSRLSPLRMS